MNILYIWSHTANLSYYTRNSESFIYFHCLQILVFSQNFCASVSGINLSQDSESERKTCNTKNNRWLMGKAKNWHCCSNSHWVARDSDAMYRGLGGWTSEKLTRIFRAEPRHSKFIMNFHLKVFNKTIFSFISIVCVCVRPWYYSQNVSTTSFGMHYVHQKEVAEYN